MSTTKAVVQGAVLGFQNPAHTGSISFLSAPSNKVSAEGKGIYKGAVQFQIAAGMGDGTGCISSAAYTDTFSPQSTKNLVEGDAPLREDDTKSIVSIPGMNGINPCTISTVVVVNDAGQSKVIME